MQLINVDFEEEFVKLIEILNKEFFSPIDFSDHLQRFQSKNTPLTEEIILLQTNF